MKDTNQLPNGAELDLRGPDANKLFIDDDFYNRIVYPKVHPTKDDWEIVDESQAQPYLPEGKARKVTLGIKEKKTTAIPMFGVESLSKTMTTKSGYVINTGGSIWGLGFAPKRPAEERDPHTQYLAVAGFRGIEHEHHAHQEETVTGTYKNAIQIWKVKLSVEDQPQPPVLDLCLLNDYGPIKSMEWCPYGAYEEDAEGDNIPKLGILCIVTGDNAVRIIAVPHPDSVRKDGDQSTVFLRLKKVILTFKLPNMIPMVASWGGHDKMACGYENGQVILWDIQAALIQFGSDKMDIRELIIYSVFANFSAVRSIVWHGVNDPPSFSTSGNDGQLQMLDWRDPHNVITYTRTRNIIYTMAWPGFSEKIWFMDGDSIMRGGEISVPFDLAQGKKLISGLAISRSMAGSEMHPFLAVSAIDGWLKLITPHGRGRRHEKYQNIVYRLDYTQETDTLRFVDGIQPMGFEETKKGLPYLLFLPDSLVALHKVVWCPNATCAGWIASGGVAGLCRIEFVGRGPHWS